MKKTLSILWVAAFLTAGSLMNMSCQPTSKSPNFGVILEAVVTQVAGYPTVTPTLTSTLTSTPSLTPTSTHTSTPTP